ncbi:hypothetical protein S83_014731 [Arachis hypogaea]
MHSWNIMIASYNEASLYSNALAIFGEFKSCNLGLDHYTLPQLFKACVGVGDYCFGKRHTRVFSKMHCRDFVAWNLMISGFLRVGLYLRVIHCFRKMLLANGGKMDSMSIPIVLIASGREGDLMKGKEVHGYVCKNSEFDVDAPVGNALIDMYGKCGCLNDSEKEALLQFQRMVDGGITPNSVALTAALASCSHSGLIEHYACMVDLLSRSGYLVEALELLKSMKSLGTGNIWGAFLAGSVMHTKMLRLQRLQLIIFFS